jgi:uncharacterized protein (DUF1778 family)
MLSTNKITLIQINEEDYKFLLSEIDRLNAENNRLKELSEQYKSEAFQAQREQWRMINC